MHVPLCQLRKTHPRHVNLMLILPSPLPQQFDIIPAIMCSHARKIGDNYGLSCQDCGERIEDYGYGGWFGSNLKGNERCTYIWANISDTQEQCMYCFTENGNTADSEGRLIA